jgi:hypothetical protein
MNKLDQLLANMQQTAAGQTAGSNAPTLGWAAGLTRENAEGSLKDPQVLADIAEFYRKRDNKTFYSDSQLLDYFYEDRNWRNLNTVSMVRDAYDAHAFDDDQAARLARLQTLYDALPRRDWNEVLADALPALALDPTNAIGFGSGKAAGTAAARGAAELGKTALLAPAVKAGIKQGVVSEGLVNAGVSGGQSLIMQNRDVELGLRDEVSLTDAAIEAGAGAALGGALGGAGGAIGGAMGGRAVERDIARAARETPPPADAPVDVTSEPVDEAVFTPVLNERQKAHVDAAKADVDARKIEVNEDKTLSQAEKKRQLDELNRKEAELSAVENWQETRGFVQQQIDQHRAVQSDPMADAKAKAASLQQIEALQLKLSRGDTAFRRVMSAVAEEDIDRIINTARESAPDLDPAPVSGPAAPAGLLTARPGAAEPTPTGPAQPIPGGTMADGGPARAGEPEPGAKPLKPEDEQASLEELAALRKEFESLKIEEQARVYGWANSDSATTRDAEIAQRLEEIRTLWKGRTGEEPEWNPQPAAFDQAIQSLPNESSAPIVDDETRSLVDELGGDLAAARNRLVNRVKDFRKAAKSDPARLDDVKKAQRQLAQVRSLMANEPEKPVSGGGEAAPVGEWATMNYQPIQAPVRPRTGPAEFVSQLIERTVTENFSPTAEGLRDFAEFNDIPIEILNADVESRLEVASESGSPITAGEAIASVMVDNAIDIQANAIMNDTARMLGRHAYNRDTFSVYLKATKTAGDILPNVMAAYDKWLTQNAARAFYDLLLADIEATPAQVLDRIQADHGSDFRRLVAASIDFDADEPTLLDTQSMGEPYGYKVGEKPYRFRANFATPLASALPSTIQADIIRLYEAKIDQLWAQSKKKTPKAWQQIVMAVERGIAEVVRRKMIDAGLPFAGSERSASDVIANMTDGYAAPVGDVMAYDPATGKTVAAQDYLTGRKWERGRIDENGRYIPDSNAWFVRGGDKGLQSAVRPALSNDPAALAYFGNLFPRMKKRLGVIGDVANLAFGAEDVAAREIEQSWIDNGTNQVVKDEVKRAANVESIDALKAEVDELAGKERSYRLGTKLHSEVRELEQDLIQLRVAAQSDVSAARLLKEKELLLAKLRKKAEEFPADEIAKIEVEIGTPNSPARGRFANNLMIKRTQLRGLTLSTKKERAGNVVEQLRKTRGDAASMLIQEVMEKFGPIMPGTPDYREARKFFFQRAREINAEIREALLRTPFAEGMAGGGDATILTDAKRKWLVAKLERERPKDGASKAEVKAYRKQRKAIEDATGAEINELAALATPEDLAPFMSAERGAQAAPRIYDPELEAKRKAEAKVRREARRGGGEASKVVDDEIVDDIRSMEIEQLHRDYADGYITKEQLDTELVALDEDSGKATTAGEADQAADTASEIARQTNASERIALETNQALEDFRLDGDSARLAKRIQEITSKYAKPDDADPMLPAGVSHAPKVVNHRGIEIDLNNDFAYVQLGGGKVGVDLLGQKVGMIAPDKGGFRLSWATDYGVQQSKLFPSKAALQRGLPEAFDGLIQKLADEGKLTRFPGSNTKATHPINWRESSKYGGQTPRQKGDIYTSQDGARPSEANAKIKTRPSDQANRHSFKIPDGQLLAIRLIDKDGKTKTVRVEGSRLAEAGTPQTVGQMIGKWPHGTEVGFVPAGTSSGSPKAAKLFRPLDQLDKADDPLATEKTAAAAPKPVAFGDLDKIELRPEDLPDFVDDVTNAAQLHDLIVRMEDIGWHKNKAAFAQHVEDLKALYAVMQKVAPAGVKYPNWRRRLIIDRVAGPITVTKDAAQRGRAIGKSIFDGYPDEARLAFMDMLQRLGGDVNEGPMIAALDPNIEPTVGGSAFLMPTTTNQGITLGSLASPGSLLSNTGQTKAANAILLGNQPIKTSVGDVPVPAHLRLAHEIGHWAYMNILSYEDRLKFWDSLSKYYDASGALDLDQLKERLPFAAAGVDGLGDLRSPSELFANQYSMWAARGGGLDISPDGDAFWRQDLKGGRPVAGGQTLMMAAAREMAKLFKGLSQKLHKLLTFFSASRDAASAAVIDPDLVPLFNKIMPEDGGVQEFWRLDVTPQTKMGRTVWNLMSHLDGYRKRIEDALLEFSPENIETVLYDVTGDLKGRFFGNDNARDTGNDLLQGPARAKLWDAQAAVREVLGKHGKNVGLTGDLDDAAEVATTDAAANALRTLHSPEDHVALASAANTLARALYDSQKGLADIWKKAGEPTSLKVGEPDPVPLSGRALGWRNRRRAIAKNIRENQRKKVERELLAEAEAAVTNLSGKTADRPKARTPKAAAFNAKTASSRDLLSRVSAGDSSDETKRELLRRAWARDIQVGEPTTDKGKALARHAQSMTDTKLSQSFYDAIGKGDGEAARALGGEIIRRTPPQVQRMGAGLLAPTEKRTIDWIGQEVADSEGYGAGDGTPPSVRADIADLVSKMTHRDPRSEAILKTLAYRLFNMLGKTAKGALDETDLISMSDMDKLLGRAPGNSIGTALDYRALMSGEQFNQLRHKLRRFALALTPGKESPHVLMHEIGHIVSFATFNDADWVRVRDGFLQALAAGGDDVAKWVGKTYEDANLYTAAAEWFAEGWARYLSDRATRSVSIDPNGQIEASSVILKSKLEMLLDQLTEFASYLLNGLIGNNDVRQMYRRLTWYGDMFSFARKEKPVADMLSGAGGEFPLHVASRAVKEIMASKTRGQLEAMATWANVYRPNQAIMLRPVNGRHTKHPDGVYLLHQAETAAGGDLIEPDIIRQRIANSDLDVQDRSAFYDMADSVGVLKRMMWDELRLYDQTHKQLHLDNVARIDGQVRAIADLLNERLRIEAPTAVKPVLVKSGRLADFSHSATYEGGSPFVTTVVNRLLSDDLITEESVAPIIQTGELAGYDLHYALLRAIIMKNGVMPDTARRMLNETLMAEGYHGVHFDHGSKRAKVIFDEARIRDLDDDFVDMPDGIFDEEVQDAPKLTGSILDEALQTEDPLNPRSTYPLMVEAQRLGMPAPMAGVVKKMFRGDAIDENDFKTAARHGFPLQLSSNSQRLRNVSNSNWLADYGENLYPSVHAAIGRDVTGVFEMLDGLPDVGGATMRWLRKNKPLATFGLSDIAQPASHERIYFALDSGDFSKLSDAEKRVAQEIAKFYDRKLQEMRDLGINIGDIRKKRGGGYVTIVWDTDQLHDNVDEAITAFKKAFLMEWERLHKEGHVSRMLAPEEAEDKARSLVLRMADHDALSHLDGHGSLGNSQVDMAFQRILAFTPEEMQKAGLHKFTVKNLKGLVAKYSEAANRRIASQRKFGSRNFALDAYKIVRDEGINGIAKILMSNRVLRSRSFAHGPEGTMTDVEIVNPIVMPITSNPVEARLIAHEIAEIVLSGGRTPEAKRAAVDRLMSLSVFNKKTEFDTTKRAEAIVEAIADFGTAGSAVSQSEKEWVDALMNAYQGRPVEGGAFSRPFYKASKRLRNFNAVTLLGFSTLASIPDMAMPLVRSGNLGAFAKAWAKFSSDPEYRRMVRNVGVAIENVVHDSLANIHGSASSRFTNAFFNANFLTPWTNIMREIGGAVGFEALRAEQARAMRLLAAGRQNSVAYRQALRFLRRYGLADYGMPGAKLISDPTQMMKDDRLRMAIIKFTNEAVFAPNPNDIPLWAQTPVGAIVFQLKSFPLMAGRLAKYTVEEAAQGNVKPLTYLLTAGAAFGSASIAIRDLAQSRGGQDEKSRELRYRNLNDIAAGFGWTEKLGIPAHDFMGWYLEGLMASGGLGMLGDLFYNQAAQLDNGAYGRERIMSYLFGPTVSLATGGINVLSGAAAMVGDEETNGRQRQMVREIVQRVPIAGGFKSLREGAVDAAAGEASTGGNSGAGGLSGNGLSGNGL